MKHLVVQKYGGATLSNAAQIKQVAQSIAELKNNNYSLVIIVSAMGKTTDSLIELANSVSSQPQRREMDMLLSAGERMSMALLSMALQEAHTEAISFTGSQAGILTNESHVSAQIIDVKAFRVSEELDKNKVVVLAGFQGVSPKTKEITTLGRGGSDTTAVAMAAYLKADRCEILKDVPGVFTADPNLVAQARLIPRLTYDQLLEMTFWGAKVLHHRSVELGKMKNVNLVIRSSTSSQKFSQEVSTLISDKEKTMYETNQVLALNSHEKVLLLQCPITDTNEALQSFNQFLGEHEIAFPQVLQLSATEKATEFLVTGPKEVLSQLEKTLSVSPNSGKIISESTCVTATCTGSTSGEILGAALNKLSQIHIKPEKVLLSSMSLSFLLAKTDRLKALEALHTLMN